MAIWSIMASPLIMSNDLRTVPASYRALILNSVLFFSSLFFPFFSLFFSFLPIPSFSFFLFLSLHISFGVTTYEFNKDNNTKKTTQQHTTTQQHNSTQQHTTAQHTKQQNNNTNTQN